jgi:hypothetical protein
MFWLHTSFLKFWLHINFLMFWMYRYHSTKHRVCCSDLKFRFGHFWRETAEECPETDGLTKQLQTYLLM